MESRDKAVARRDFEVIMGAYAERVNSAENLQTLCDILNYMDAQIDAFNREYETKYDLTDFIQTWALPVFSDDDVDIPRVYSWDTEYLLYADGDRKTGGVWYLQRRDITE